MPASMVVSVPLNISKVPDIKVPNMTPVTNFSKTLGYKDSAPPTYHNPHHNTII